jgi:hypothetical protein
MPLSKDSRQSGPVVLLVVPARKTDRFPVMGGREGALTTCAFCSDPRIAVCIVILRVERAGDKIPWDVSLQATAPSYRVNGLREELNLSFLIVSFEMI